ncbi:MAG: DUF6916 family protein [Methylobacter sp.]
MNLSFEQASPLVGTNFTVHTQAGLIDLELIDVAELPRRNIPEQFRTPLSLVFTGPPDLLLQQGIYLIEHAELGQNEWLMGPILSINPGSNDNKLYYEIMFA